jgi:RNA polymerase sigma factor (sigma-70 family)
VAQNVFTALARKAPSLVGRTALTGWLYLGAHHAAAQAVRGEQRRRVRETEASTMHDLISSATPATDWDRVRSVLDDAMRELTEPDREAVLLRYFERRPFADIGAALHLTEDAARMRVDRALEKLRALLARRGVTSTAAALTAALANQAMVAAPAGLAASIAGSAAAGGGAATAAAGFFMATSTFVASAVALVAIGSTIYQLNQNRRTGAELALLARERDGLRAQMRETQQRTATAEQQNGALQRDLAAARAAKAAAEIAARPPPPAGALSFGSAPARNANGQIIANGGILTLRASPAPNDPAESRRLTREMNIESRDASYRAFYRLAGFTPAQQEQFKALFVDNMDRTDERVKSVMTAAMAQNPRPDRSGWQPVVESTVKQNYDEFLTTIRTNFGDATFQAFQHYTDTMASRGVTKELSSALFYTDTPLTVAQAEQLVEVVAANSRNAQGKVDLPAMNTDAILAQAQAFLSPPQLAALRRTQLEVKLKWTPTEHGSAATAAAKAPGN